MKGGSRVFSLNYLFASFFGALMIAGAFAYFNYRFSEYKFIDFSRWVYYEKSDIFTPKSKRYTVVVYSSNMQNINQILKKINKSNPIIAIDLYQKKRGKKSEVMYLTSDINTLLKLIQRFNIYEVPSAFIIQRYKKALYKQDSMVEVIK
jgi:uncharacterized membrane-anchored protein YitT (DUF2179 family)